MSDEEIFRELRGMCAQILSVDPETIAHDTDLREELEADSLDLVELAAVCQDRFGVGVSLDEAKQARTLGDMLALVPAGSRRAATREG